MEQLDFFVFLVMQATFMGAGLVIVLAVAALLFATGNRSHWLWRLPAIWLLPLALGGLFVEVGAGAKTADWMGWVALTSLAAFAISSVWLLQPGAPSRSVQGLWIAVNAPLALFSTFVTGLAAGGTWP